MVVVVTVMVVVVTVTMTVMGVDIMVTMVVVDVMVATVMAIVIITVAHRIRKELARMATSMEEKSSRVLSEIWLLKRAKHLQRTVATRSTLGMMIW